MASGHHTPRQHLRARCCSVFCTQEMFKDAESAGEGKCVLKQDSASNNAGLGTRDLVEEITIGKTGTEKFQILLNCNFLAVPQGKHEPEKSGHWSILNTGSSAPSDRRSGRGQSLSPVEPMLFCCRASEGQLPAQAQHFSVFFGSVLHPKVSEDGKYHQAWDQPNCNHPPPLSYTAVAG